MCKTTPLQHKIQKRTGNGDLIANFLADTIEGKYPDAKYHHKLEAAKLLARYGETGNDLNRHSCGSRNPAGQGEGSGEGHSKFWGLIPTPEELATAKHEENEQSPISPRERVRVRGANNTPSPSTGEGWDGGEQDKNPPHPVHPVTYIDILNYDIAHLIRQETGEGHTIAEFLAHVMTRRDQPFTPKKLRIRHVDRMAAAKEILRRGHGHWGRKPKLKVYADDAEDTNDYDTLHTDLAKRMREYNEHGTDAIRFLLDVMSDTSLDPEEGYTWHHKMSAAHELIRRGWDTNYDKITPEMLQAYWQDQQSTRLSIGQKKQLAGLPTFLDEYDHYDTTDYQAIAEAIRDQEDREEAADFKAASAPGRSPLSPGERVRVRGNTPASSPSETNEATIDRHSCEACPRPRSGSRNPAASRNPLSPRERARVRGNTPASSPSENNAATPTRHSRENGNPAAPKSPLSPRERARVRGTHNTPSFSTAQRADEAEHDNTSSPSCTSMSVPPDEETTNPFVLSPALSLSKGLSKDEPASNRMNNAASPNRHSCKACPRPRSGSRNPAASKSPLSPRERARVRGTENTSHPSTAQRADEAEHDNTSSPSCTSTSIPPDDLDCYYEPLTPEDQAIFNYNSLIESGEFEEGEITFVPPSEAAHRDYAIALKQIREAAEAEGIPLLPNPLAGALKMPTIRSP